MKTYLMAVLMIFISSQAIACTESNEEREARFNLYDTNKDGYADAGEWSILKPGDNFEEVLKVRDKDGDKKLSRDEFLAIGFVRGC